jgi:hypothetical protein
VFTGRGIFIILEIILIEQLSQALINIATILSQTTHSTPANNWPCPANKADILDYTYFFD